MKTQWQQLALGVLACAIAFNSSAQGADSSWILRFGAHVVDPASNNGYLAGAKTSNCDNFFVHRNSCQKRQRI